MGGASAAWRANRNSRLRRFRLYPDRRPNRLVKPSRPSSATSLLLRTKNFCHELRPGIGCVAIPDSCGRRKGGRRIRIRDSHGAEGSDPTRSVAVERIGCPLRQTKRCAAAGNNRTHRDLRQVDVFRSSSKPLDLNRWHTQQLRWSRDSLEIIFAARCGSLPIPPN